MPKDLLQLESRVLPKLNIKRPQQSEIQTVLEVGIEMAQKMASRNKHRDESHGREQTRSMERA